MKQLNQPHVNPQAELEPEETSSSVWGLAETGPTTQEMMAHKKGLKTIFEFQVNNADTEIVQ